MESVELVPNRTALTTERLAGAPWPQRRQAQVALDTPVAMAHGDHTAIRVDHRVDTSRCRHPYPQVIALIAGNRVQAVIGQEHDFAALVVVLACSILQQTLEQLPFNPTLLHSNLRMQRER